MKRLFSDLMRFGCNVEEALDRVVGDEDLYVDCLESIEHDKAFFALGEALKKNDADAAIENAHTLKGVLGNLSLTPLYETVKQIVDALRGGNADGLAGDYEKLMAQRQTLEDLIKKNKPR